MFWFQGGWASERLRGDTEDPGVAGDSERHAGGRRAFGGPSAAALARPRHVLQRLLPVLGDDTKAVTTMQ